MIKYSGRINHQVKIRGFQIELKEIEAALLQYPTVRQTIVIAREDNSGDQYLVAYIVPQQQSVTGHELRSFLKQKLADYMVPSAFVILAQMPLTLLGEVDYLALPEPEPSRPDLEREIVAPRDALELQLTEIWSSVLGVQPICITDNFFDLGGESLEAISLQTEIQQKLGLNLPLANFFQDPTIEKSAIILRTSASSSQSSLVQLQPKGINQPLFFINSITYAKRLIPYLSSEQPFYGLSIFGLPDMDDQQLSLLRIEDIAAQFIQEMRLIQQEGPYFLTAYCRDACIAFEMAQQLQALGEQVAILALIDVIWEPRALGVHFYWHNLRQFGFDYVWSKLKNRLRLTKEALDIGIKNIIGHFYSQTGSKLPRSSQDIKFLKAYHQASYNYVPQTYSGQVNLYLSSEWQFKNSDKLASLVTGKLETQVIPGYHNNLFEEPQIGFLGALLNDCINKLFQNK